MTSASSVTLLRKNTMTNNWMLKVVDNFPLLDYGDLKQVHLLRVSNKIRVFPSRSVYDLRLLVWGVLENILLVLFISTKFQHRLFFAFFSSISIGRKNDCIEVGHFFTFWFTGFLSNGGVNVDRFPFFIPFYFVSGFKKRNSCRWWRMKVFFFYLVGGGDDLSSRRERDVISLSSFYFLVLVISGENHCLFRTNKI